MSYTVSKAETGSQTVFNIKISSTFTPIFEILSFTQSNHTNKTVDVTNLNSTAEEWISVLKSSTNYELTLNRVSTDPGQAGLIAAFGTGALTDFKIVLPLEAGQSTTGDTYTFSAIVEDMNDLADVAPNKQVTSKVKLKTSGAVAFAAGA